MRNENGGLFIWGVWNGLKIGGLIFFCAVLMFGWYDEVGWNVISLLITTCANERKIREIIFLFLSPSWLSFPQCNLDFLLLSLIDASFLKADNRDITISRPQNLRKQVYLYQQLFPTHFLIFGTDKSKPKFLNVVVPRGYFSFCSVKTNARTSMLWRGWVVAIASGWRKEAWGASVIIVDSEKVVYIYVLGIIIQMQLL